MKIGNDEILMLYTLLDNRELGEYLPLPVLTQRAGLPANEAKAVALSLERAGLIACEVDAHLAESGGDEAEGHQGKEQVRDTGIRTA